MLQCLTSRVLTIMTDQQKVILNMMKWFHNFCETHNLHYFLIGGTLLGAVRHNGFIPWDDDADVGMPRGDYEKFIDLTKSINTPYCVESPKNCKSDYQWPFAKVYDPNTTLIENSNIKCVRGVWMDIFPIDGTLNGGRRIFKYSISRALLNVLALKKIAVKTDRAPWKKVVIALFKPLSNCISTLWLIKLIDNFCAESDFSESEYMADMVWGSGWKCHTPKYFWDNPKLYKFEDSFFFGIADSDKYLTQLYGNYRELPSVENRVNHDVLYVDLMHGWDSFETQKCLNKLLTR